MAQERDADRVPAGGAGFNDPRRWAGRLAFPAAAVAVVLALRAVREPGAATAWWLAATLAGVAALVLLRLRRGR